LTKKSCGFDQRKSVNPFESAVNSEKGGTKLKAQDVLDLAGRNLRESVLRNSLTTMGIAVGVASLVAMLSLGIGLQTMASKRLTHAGLFDTLLVSSRRDFRGFNQRQETGPAVAIDESVRANIAKLPKVIEVYPEIRFPTEVRYADKPNFGMIVGLVPSAAQNEAFEDEHGRFFSSPEANEAILLSDFAKELEPNSESLIGKDITLSYAERQPLSGVTDPNGFSVVRRELKLRVVGIVEREPYGGFRGMGSAGVFIPMQLAETLNVMQPNDLRGFTAAPAANGRTFASLTVRVASPTDVESVENAVKKMGFSAFSLLDATRNLRRFFAVLDLFLGIFGSLALAVASLGIINTLVMAILERRREIGIMKAIGASDSDVKRLFFAEASAMGAMGGALGVLLGWLIGRLINFGTNFYLQRQQLPREDIWLVPWWLVAGAILFALLVTLVSGLYPAARAAKLDPVQALRYE
jgi:putative ABC transport system permease protein